MKSIKPEFFHNMIDRSTKAVIISDKQGVMLNVNDMAVESFQYQKPEEMINKNLKDLFIYKEKEKVKQLICQTFDSGSVRNVYLTCIRQDSFTFNSECNTVLIPNSDSSKNIFAIYLKDVTPSKILTEDILTARNIFRLLWDKTPYAMSLLNKNGAIISINRLFCALFEKKPSQVLGKCHKQVFKESNFTEIPDTSKKNLKNKCSFRNSKIRKILEPDKIIEYKIENSVIELYANNSVILNVFIETLANRKKGEETHESSKFEAIGNKLNLIIHKLKNPLTSIGIVVEILKEEYGSQPNQLRLFDILEKQLLRSNNYLNQILHFSEGDELDKKQLYPYYVIEHVRYYFNTVLKEKNISFTNLTNQHIIIIGDESKLFLSFQALVENAIEAININGSIEVYHKIDQNHKFVKIYVKDSGSGIENVKILFEPLYSTKPDGIGFGLAIAREIFEAHNGSIRLLSSTPGKTIFEVSLPLNEF